MQGKYKYKPAKFIPDYEPATLITCKKCIYRETYGCKNRNKMMKARIIEKQSLKK